ncbi:MAG: DUF4062 domain-containing protein, partial [Calditrichaeota bacterium]
HDTNLFEVDPNFSRWVMDFKANILEVLNRMPAPPKQFFLSQDLTISRDQPARIHSDDFCSFIVLMTDELNRIKNLKEQFEQIFDLSGEPDKNPAGKKVVYVMLSEFAIDYYMLQIPDKKILKFYKKGNIDVYNPRNTLDPQNREYWLQLMEILEFIAMEPDESGTDIQLMKNQVIVYVGQVSPDLEDKRDQLISEMKRRGIQVIPEMLMMQGNTVKSEKIVDLLEYSDLIVQMIGGEYGKTTTEAPIAFQEQEFDIISKYLAGEIPNTLIINKPHPRVIWMPEDIIITDRKQDEFINKVKRQIWYLKEDTEIITGSFEKLKEFIFNSLKTRIVHRVKRTVKKEQNVVYLIHEKSMYKEVQDLTETLRPFQFSLILTHDLITHQSFIRAHKETMNRCDGVIIYYGFENELWYESTIKEVIKANQVHREKPFMFKIVVAGKNLLDGLQQYSDFIYVNPEKLSDLKVFYNHLNKTIG